MCVRTLKRRLRSLGLKRKCNARIINDSEIRSVIREEMRGPGSLSGYRSFWHALRLRHHIHVPRNLVANIMKEIDPFGVEEGKSRRSKGLCHGKFAVFSSKRHKCNSQLPLHVGNILI